MPCSASRGGIAPAARARPTQPAPNPFMNWRRSSCDPTTRSVRLPAGVRLDFGGVAKGWAADQRCAGWPRRAPRLVDAGRRYRRQWTDRAARAGRSASTPRSDHWPSDTALELLNMPAGGVATSGRDFRRWQQDGAWRHHLIDPRTGVPGGHRRAGRHRIAPTAGEAEVAGQSRPFAGQRGRAWPGWKPGPPWRACWCWKPARSCHSRRLPDYLGALKWKLQYPPYSAGATHPLPAPALPAEPRRCPPRRRCGRAGRDARAHPRPLTPGTLARPSRPPPSTLPLGLLIGACAGRRAARPAHHPGLGAHTGRLPGRRPSRRSLWYLSRASGLVAFVLLWVSMASGLIITNKMARIWPGAFTAFDLHQYTSLLGLGFIVFHTWCCWATIISASSLVQLLVPFAGGDYRPIWVGLGQIGVLPDPW